MLLTKTVHSYIVLRIIDFVNAFSGEILGFWIIWNKNIL